MSSNKKVKKIKKVQDKKNIFKIVMIVVCSVLAALLIAGIIMGCIPKKAFNIFNDYKTVKIYTSADTTSAALTVFNDDSSIDKGDLNTGLKKSRYSVLRGVFEGVFSSAYKFQIDSDSENVVIKGKDVLTESAVKSDAYLLEFSFRDNESEPLKSIKVKGTTVEFDTARINVTYFQNTIESYAVYLYNSYKLDSNVDEYYEITPVLIKARTVHLYPAIETILERHNISKN